MRPDYVEGLMSRMRKHSQAPPVKLPGRSVAGSPDHKFPGSESRLGGMASTLFLFNRRSALPMLTLLAVLGIVLMFLLPGGLASAQTVAPIEFPENSEEVVATFTAEDPEGATPIAWTLLASSATDPTGVDADVDSADAEDFMINKDGELKFNIAATSAGSATGSPDFERPLGAGTTPNNTYNVVVVACDVALTGDPAACPDTGKAAYHKVEVKVTNMDEPGKVTLGATGGVTTGTPQYLVGTTLTATASDGDITNATQSFVSDVADEVTGVVWRWYRGGGQIAGATSNVYTLTSDDEGQHIRAVVFYLVEGNVDREEASVTTEYPVLGGRVGVNQLKFDPATVSMTISEGAKGRNVGSPVTATGNHGTIRYSLADSGDGTTAAPRFKIDDKTGQITTEVVLDYEGDSPATATDAGSCAGATTDTPDRECTVTVIATDSTGEPTSGTAPNLSATVTIKITDVDEKPTFSTGAKTVGVPEGSTALFHATADGYTVTEAAPAAGDGVTYTAADPEGRTVSYSLAGPDASKFQLSNDPPVLSFVSKPDFEAKASADGDNVYEVTARATAGGKTGERAVRVTVSNVDEGPEISGPSTKNFVENSKDPVATYTAEDPEGVTPIAWLLATATHVSANDDLATTDNADATDHFTIDKDGALKFSSPPDYENPSGEGGTSNTYKVVVAACDLALDGGACPTAGKLGFHKVTVTVTKVDEPGTVALVTDTTDGTPQYLVGAELTATATDGDITDSEQTFQATERAGEVTGIVWRWYRGGGQIPGADAEDNTYTLVDADVGQRIRVEVRYLVAGNTQQESASLTTEHPVLAALVGDSQHKFDPATVSRTISEGAKDRNVGAPVTSTGNHGTVRYSLADSGDATATAPKFKIDEKTGQISTAVELNFEAAADAADNCATTRNTCTVTVTAKDSTGVDATNTATVTITITDVDEKPDFSTGAKTVGVPEGSTALYHATADGYTATAVTEVTYTATDPERRTVAYSLAGPDASKFQLSGSPPVLSFVSKPDFEAKASADGDNVYEVTIRAIAGGKTGERAVRVTVADVDEAPEIERVTGPAVRGQDRPTYAEDRTDAVATYTASGFDGTVSWSLTGVDRGDFSISNAGVLTFSTSPNFESPADADGDNTYMVTVTATRGADSATRDVTVRVTDVEEQGCGDALVDKYDANSNCTIQRGEVIAAINDYLDEGDGAPTRADVIKLINRYLDGA